MGPVAQLTSCSSLHERAAEKKSFIEQKTRIYVDLGSVDVCTPLSSLGEHFVTQIS